MERMQKILQAGMAAGGMQNNEQDPEFQRITQRFLYGDVAHHGTLSDTQRALIVLVSADNLPDLAGHRKIYTGCAGRGGYAGRDQRSAYPMHPLYWNGEGTVRSGRSESSI